MVKWYILELYSSRVYDMKLPDSYHFTLSEFAMENEMYIAKICNRLKDTEYKVEYKNVHKKISRYIMLSLIKRIEFMDRKYNSKSFRLTSKGVFCIFYFLYQRLSLIQNQIQDLFKGMIYNYGDDEFFHFFVYPFIDKNTLLKLKSVTVIEYFLKCFTEFAQKLLSILFEITVVEKNADDKEDISLRKKEHVEKFLTYLNLRLEETELAKNEIWFNQSPNVLSEENVIFCYPGAYDNFFNEYLVSELKIEMTNIIDREVIMPIIAQGKYYSSERFKDNTYKPHMNKNWQDIRDDLGLLIKDKKFYDLLNSTIRGFSNCYDNIVSII
jgi:hypothetical protein